MSGSTQAADLIEVLSDAKVARNHTFMTAKVITDVQPGSPFYITIANFGKGDSTLPKHQKVSEIKNAPQEVNDIKDERLSYLCGTEATKRDS